MLFCEACSTSRDLNLLRYVVTRTRSEYSGRSSSKYKKAMSVDISILISRTRHIPTIKKALNESSNKNKSKSKYDILLIL